MQFAGTSFMRPIISPQPAKIMQECYKYIDCSHLPDVVTLDSPLSVPPDIRARVPHLNIKEKEEETRAICDSPSDGSVAKREYFPRDGQTCEVSDVIDIPDPCAHLSRAQRRTEQAQRLSRGGELKILESWESRPPSGCGWAREKWNWRNKRAEGVSEAKRES